MNKPYLFLLLFASMIFSLSGCPWDDVATTPAGNAAPVADAGDDRCVNTGDEVVLDGSGSSDPDNDQLEYQWLLDSQPATSTATLLNPTLVAPSFVPDVDGIYGVKLVVNDGVVDSSPDWVIVSATSSGNCPPVADAGADRTVVSGILVTLDGSGSFDPDGNPIQSYQWDFVSQPPASALTLADADTVSPSFTPVETGDYVISLVVYDGLLYSDTDEVTITVSGLVGNFADGQAKYDAACASCHAAGAYDVTSKSAAGDLYSDGELLILAISTINGMSSVADLTEQEKLDLFVFLENITP